MGLQVLLRKEQRMTSRKEDNAIEKRGREVQDVKGFSAKV